MAFWCLFCFSPHTTVKAMMPFFTVMLSIVVMKERHPVKVSESQAHPSPNIIHSTLIMGV